MTEVPFAAHGYGAYFALSLLDRCVPLISDPSCVPHHHLPLLRYHDPEATLEEGLATLRRCLDEVAKRLVVSPSKYKVKIVDKDGVREIEL